MHLEAFRKEYEKLKLDFVSLKDIRGLVLIVLIFICIFIQRKAKISQTNDQDMVRIDLMGSDFDDSYDQKTKLLGEDTQRMEATDRRLTEGYRLALESEQIGSQILENLNQQRETIQRSRDRLRVTNHDLKRSGKILGLMTRRSLQTRVLIYFIFTVICIFFVYLIYDSMV